MTESGGKWPPFFITGIGHTRSQNYDIQKMTEKTNKTLTPTQAASALWLVQNAVGYEDVLGDEQCGFGDAIRPAVDAALAAQEEALAAGKDDCDANDAMYPAFLKAVMELTDGTEEQVDAEFDRISEENSVA